MVLPPLFIATIKCANELSIYLADPKRTDQLKSLEYESVIKCISLPDSSSVPFFDQMVPVNESLTKAMQNFD